jgi:hypothetical protein
MIGRVNNKLSINYKFDRTRLCKYDAQSRSRSSIAEPIAVYLSFGYISNHINEASNK